MRDQSERQDNPSYKLVIDILADLVKEFQEKYTPSADSQGEKASTSE